MGWATSNEPPALPQLLSAAVTEIKRIAAGSSRL